LTHDKKIKNIQKVPNYYEREPKNRYSYLKKKKKKEKWEDLAGPLTPQLQ